MPRLNLVTEIAAPPHKVFDLARSIDLHIESMARTRERAIRGVTSGLIGLDEEVTWEARHFGVRWNMTSRITEFDFPSRFVDEMATGPFSSFRHEHVLEPMGAGTTMTDVLDFETRFGSLSPIADRVAAIYLRALLRKRNDMIRVTAEMD